LKEGQDILGNLDKIVFVHEPPSAISGGGQYHPQDPEEADTNAAKISERIGKKVTTIYGGSINPQNAASFFSQKNIDGGLVGQASLNPSSFVEIIEAVS
ncbi:MAG: triose-phosphate isomerase, partial [Candidatus Paceibacterales bacterium]